MFSILLQVVLPFTLSAIVVILIMYIAERYGTKIGGIFGTLPSTIVIAFIFIALNQNVDFAAKSAAVVPAELGINVIFLLLFALLVYHSIYFAFFGSLTIWTILSLLLFIFNLENIFVSISIYIITIIVTIIVLERVKKIPSSSNITVHYTPSKIALRGVLAGTVISIAVILSNIGATLSGIFSVFPAILSSIMLISFREHGPKFAAGMAKSMTIGISSVVAYATAIHFLFPIYNIYIGTLVAYIVSIVVTLIIFRLRDKIR